MTVRCESADKERWESAAQADSRDLNAWVRVTLNHAAADGANETAPDGSEAG